MAIKKLYITSVNPLEYVLNLDMMRSGEWQGLTVFNMEGLGPPKATVSSTGSPNTDGMLVTSVKTDARHMMLTLVVVPYAFGTEEEAKQKIYDAFPIKQEITVRIETYDDKDVYITAFVESVEMNIFAKTENAVISLFCPEPYFLDMNHEILPISSSSTVVVYDGEVKTGFDIGLSFTAFVSTGMTLTNGSQSMHLDFSNMPASIAINDIIEINTRAGKQYIKFWDASEGEWFNIFNVVDQDADWIELLLGSNTFDYDTDVGGDIGDVSMAIIFRPLYEGV